MKWKKLLSAAVLSAAMLVNASAINLYVDSVKLEPEVPPTVVDGHTLVPLRAIFDALGASLEWDNSTQTATGRRADNVVSIQISSPTAYVNGEAKALEAPAQILGGSTMVPARFVAEALDCIVKWDAATDGIYISTTGLDPVIPEAPAQSVPAVQPAPVTPAPQTGTTTSPSVQTQETKPSGDIVYITRTGKRYHYSSSCNGGTYYESTLSQAKQRGLTPCQKCAS